MSGSAESERGAVRTFWPLGLITGVAAVMLLVNLSIRGYSQVVSLPRYCGSIDQTLGQLEQILTQSRPAADADHRAYLIAAKLLFLVPQQAGEPGDAYLARVRSDLQERCR